MASCRERFDLNVELATYALLPDYFRNSINDRATKVEFLFLAYSLTGQIDYTVNNLVQKCRDLESFLGYTGQIGSLEVMLNDYLDPIDRSITIEILTIFRVDTLNVKRNNEEAPFIKNFVSKNNETFDYQHTVYKNNESKLEQPFAFKVVLPIGLILQDYQINTLLQNYVPAGVRWYIERL